CDSLLIGKECGAHTFPYIEVKHPGATVEHEATTSKISDDQMFYCRSRGLGEEDAVSLIVDGFCKQVFRELPMEFAVEAKKLLEVSFEGSGGGLTARLPPSPASRGLPPQAGEDVRAGGAASAARLPFPRTAGEGARRADGGNPAKFFHWTRQTCS